MSVKTKSANVANAIRLYKSAQGMFFGFGNYKTPWNTADNPPQPLGTENTLNELLGLIKVSNVYLARPAKPGDTNTFTYSGKTYQKVSLGSAYAEGATFVLITVDLQSDMFPYNTYRSVGLIDSPQYSPSVTGNVIQASSLTSVGNLLTIKYVPKVDYTGYTITEQILIEN